MKGMESFSLGCWDYLAFIGYFVVLSAIGYWAGRRRTRSDEYFLAGRSLPWYVVGCSFIASNISAEQFIGMIGAAFIYGICAAIWEWGNVLTFSILIWFFIPFLLASKVFTTPEFMERRFNNTVRQFFAVVTVITNVVAFLAAVLYGGGVALQELFGWDIWLAILVVGLLAGLWAIYGGLKSVAWMDVFTVMVMIGGGLTVTFLGLASLSERGGIIDGFSVMIERNHASDGIYAEVVAQNTQQICHEDHYNRLSVIQPISHTLLPWPNLIFMLFTISIWYNVINQFMIQRVLGAKDMYHARMGIVLAGFMKVLLPMITVIPGLILFAHYPELMRLEWLKIQTEADKGYVHMLQTVIPIGIRGIFLAALFGAIQSTVQAVLNSTSTIFTMDIYKRMFKQNVSEQRLVRIGRISSVVIMILSIALARLIALLPMGLFEYVQNLYAFFAPPFAAIFLLGILFRRINGAGATAAVFFGFAFSIAIKLYIWLDPSHPVWLKPFMTQATIVWLFSVAVCVLVSLFTRPPLPVQVSDQLTINWGRLNIFGYLGNHWYTHVVLWWGMFVIMVLALVMVFSGIWF
ncbi:MAG: sodium:solute symporter family transporter [Planctomycetota bacterium]|jgi:SSS family solute:Na+ symporter